VFTWGIGSWGCLGHGDQENILEPERVKGALLGGSDVVAIAVSSDGTAAVTE
jgi:hypothetical protein